MVSTKIIEDREINKKSYEHYPELVNYNSLVEGNSVQDLNAESYKGSQDVLHYNVDNKDLALHDKINIIGTIDITDNIKKIQPIASKIDKLQDVNEIVNPPMKIEDENHYSIFTLMMSLTLDRYYNMIDVVKSSEIRHIAMRNKMEGAQVSCVMSFKGSRINKRAKNCHFKIVEYAICKQSNCRWYKFVYEVMEHNLRVQVYFKGTKNINHTEEHSYQLKGMERNLVKEKLKKTLPNVVRYEDIDKVDSELVLDGNWQKLRSLPVYQKARSEALSDEDRHSDPVLDMLLRAKDETAGNQYIHFPDGRTLVYLYSKEQISILIKKGQKVNVYFDATGSVVRPSQYDKGHRVLYYALVVNVQSKLIPLAELISSKHDSTTIMCFLVNFKHFVRVTCNKSWPIFDTIVTDWSFALLTSVCQAFNDMTLYTYLKICYRFVTNCLEDSRFTAAVVLKTCCAHFLKMICKKLSKLKQNKNIKNLITDAVGVLLQCTSMVELQFQFENVLILLLSPIYSDDVKRAIIELSSDSYIKGESLMNSTDKEEYHFEDDDESVRGDYISSPFFGHFFRTYDKILTQVKNNDEKHNETQNQYKSEEFCMYLLKRVMPFVPLWTDILGSGRYSNSNVESWFKILKKEILQNQTNLKVGRFVHKIRSRIQVELKSINLQIGRIPKKKRKDESHVDMKEIDNPRSEEKWKKKQVDRSGFLYKKRLTMLEHALTKKTNNHPGLEIAQKTNQYVNSNSITLTEKCKDEDKTTNEIIMAKIDENDEKSASEVIIDKKEYDLTESDDEIAMVTKDQPDERALENGLFFCNEFYMTCAMNSNFCIGIYTYKQTQQSIYLQCTDFRSLISMYNTFENIPTETERWLTDYCIDALAYSILKNKTDVYYIDTVSTQILFSDICKNYRKFTPFVISLKKINYILLPYNDKGQHWVLIVLDIRNHTIHILNPSSRYSLNKDEILQNIKRFFGTRDRLNVESNEKLTWRKWKVDTKVKLYPKQDDKDGVNCGVYVAFYIYVLSNIQDMDNFEVESTLNIDPERIRITLQNILLISSDNVYDRCLKCGKMTKEKYVQCGTCHRWLHIENCSETSEAISQIEQPDFHFTCFCCEIYGNDPFYTRNRNKTVLLNEIELRIFVKQHQKYLMNTYNNRLTNEEGCRYREIGEPNKHLKWDYTVTFLGFNQTLKIFENIIESTTISDNEFICYVLLGLMNKKIVYKYYGLLNKENIIDKFKELNDIEELDIDYPVPYTLDEVLREIETVTTNDKTYEQCISYVN